MTVTVNCGTGGRQAPNYKTCRIFDDVAGKGCQLEVEHDPGGLYVRLNCHKGVRTHTVDLL